MTAYGPCENWVEWSDVEAVCTPPNLDPAVQELVLNAASEIMWMLSGRQFGLCSVTARPMACCSHGYGGPWTWWSYGGWYMWGSVPGRNAMPCSCARYNYVHLGRAPIASVDEVIVNGVIVDPSEYRVDEFNYLVRLTGDPWPFCTSLADDDDQSGVFQVTWTYGLDVPSAGLSAAALLACRLAHDLDANNDCALPASASSVSAEQVTIQLDKSAIAENGRTGILLVDLWLQSVAPAGPGGMADGFDPGGRREWWRTGTWVP